MRRGVCASWLHQGLHILKSLQLCKCSLKRYKEVAINSVVVCKPSVSVSVSLCLCVCVFVWEMGSEMES
jgi:hypothetical protein